ncbi:MAG TPA: TRAP transporter substrate-binding protein [Bacillota bacterium]
MKFKRSLLLFTLVVMVMMTGWSGAYAKTVLTYAHETNYPHPVYLHAEKFKELVAEISGGKMELIVYPAGELGAALEVAQQAKMGSIDMALLGTPIVQFLPDYGAFDMPYLFKNREHAYKVAWGEIGQELSEKLLEKTGLIVLTTYENGFRQITNSVRPINTPADLKGIKLRTPSSKIRIETFKTFGAAPTPMAWTEVYGALQRGVIDGQENPVGNAYSGKLWEVQKYLSITNHVYGFQFVLMNKKSFDRLSKEEQGYLLEAARKASEWQINWCAENEKKIIDDLEKEGMQVNYADMEAFQKVALEKIWPRYEKEYGELIRRIMEAGK